MEGGVNEPLRIRVPFEHVVDPDRVVDGQMRTQSACAVHAFGVEVVGLGRRRDEGAVFGWAAPVEV
jgi:hypothetical protein